MNDVRLHKIVLVLSLHLSSRTHVVFCGYHICIGGGAGSLRRQQVFKFLNYVKADRVGHVEETKDE